MLVTSAFFAILLGVVHSYLGERYILIRLFKRELPKLLGDDWFTKRVLRFAWHLTTVAWWGFAGILFILSNPGEYIQKQILMVIAVVFLVSGLFSASFTKGKHISWIFFWLISGLSFYVAKSMTFPPELAP
ncbi:hypothetical protein [Vibrio hangzhouensis]|uniref:Uncharacterized protein n=1 Tax=Vibrio hangzhouensis TaxID=462991 RepID=A0A1H5RRJ0_9VIBR|nr:hypothetical protein [Vibrio hangzhouensis]SEF40923.1 hypothetical protein SAMN04488244_10185 [Vibrio hangzhouensis]